MKGDFQKMTFQLLLLTVSIFTIHWSIVQFVLNNVELYFSVETTYIFHFFITYIIIATLLAVKNIIPDKIGFLFMGFSIFKMGISILFLFPLSKVEGLDPIPDVLSFFTPYFIFLFYETFYLVSLLNKDSL
jgi:hypothetical protein